MTKYSLGFLFDRKLQKVLLIKKIKPDYLKGRYNGIGGKLEKNEDPFDCMIREFQEEAGIPIKFWVYYCNLLGEKYNINIYFAINIDNLKPKSMTEEKVKWFNVKKLPSTVMPNLTWLIPMALSFDSGERAICFKIKEEL